MNKQLEYDDDFRRLNIDRMLAEHDLDRRRHLRVRPAFQTPVVFAWQGHEYKLLDISRGGFSFVNSAPIDPGWQLQGRLRFPRREEPMEVKVVVVGSGEEGLIRCMFEEVSAEDLAALTLYIKDRSKELLSFYFKELAPS